ncbi:unnamed protein product [Cochlearia groenlandica]
MDYYNDDDEDMINNESDDDYNDHYSDDNEGVDDVNYGFAEETTKTSRTSYVVLKEEDIRKNQRQDIERIANVLSVTESEAILLLLCYRWNVARVEEEWFSDEDRVRKSAGIFKCLVLQVKGKKIKCGICFESCKRDEIETVSCGHPFCKACWSGYITVKINDGPGCLMVKCPEPSCSAMLGQDFVNKVITKEEYKDKYYSYFLRSYVEESGNRLKWCPSPGCEHAIDFGVGIGNGSSDFDVYCSCSYGFCWNCGEDPHRPVDCETVAKWIFKNNDESENTNWILANTKPCPKCKRQIEKNQGCNHMTCREPCGHQFCWLCLRDNKSHNRTCNKFQGESEEESKRKLSKQAIDKYIHYFERWATNQSSRVKAMSDLEKLRSVHMEVLCRKQCTSESQINFTVEAWDQIIECRRVLKWTYAYGYYLSDEEKAKKRFFEYLQGEAELGLERLHQCAELELNQFLVDKTEGPNQNFDEFRKKLITLTKATKTYFENLVKALENGLDDVTLGTENKSTTK